VDYGDHTETCKEGDFYYMPPGHVPRASAGTELIQFTPKEENEKTTEAIMKNVAAMMGSMPKY
jgi:predicted YcjX-like family ATPase